MQLFGFIMDTFESLESTLDELKCMIIELVDLDGILSNENQAIIFLLSPCSFLWSKECLLVEGLGWNLIYTVVYTFRIRYVELKQENIELVRVIRKTMQMVNHCTLEACQVKEKINDFKKKGRSQSKERSK